MTRFGTSQVASTSSPPRPTRSSRSCTANANADSDESRRRIDEEYLLLLLSDSNLPTGGFVASSGLESFIQHGYLVDGSSESTPERGLVEFVEMSLDNYSRLNEPIVTRAYRAIERYENKLGDRGQLDDDNDDDEVEVENVVKELYEVDRTCDEMILNQVGQRASIAQGNALLSLYSRALAPSSKSPDRIARVIERVRTEVRKDANRSTSGPRSERPDPGWKGHQSTSFGIVMSAVGLSLDRALHLFLFLHARSILSSAVRLNVIGPYSAHRLLLFDVRRLVDRRVSDNEIERRRRRTKDSERDSDDDETEQRGIRGGVGTDLTGKGTATKKGDWWDDDEDWAFLADEHRRRTDGHERDPVTTWPLGEIVASRHDQLFTKVFNS